MTQTRSRTATIGNTILEEISGKLSFLMTKLLFSRSISKTWKTEFSVFNEFIPNEPIKNECDFVKQTTENMYETSVDAIT